MSTTAAGEQRKDEDRVRRHARDPVAEDPAANRPPAGKLDEAVLRQDGGWTP